jgi:hypothetical protein
VARPRFYLGLSLTYGSSPTIANPVVEATMNFFEGTPANAPKTGDKVYDEKGGYAGKAQKDGSFERGEDKGYPAEKSRKRSKSE